MTEPHALNLTIGVVWADDCHSSPDDLIRDADAAMYSAKELGRGGYALFDRDMRAQAAERAQLEALVRWQHPERGLLEPADFLGMAIESRLIVPIGRWALRKVGRQAAAWIATGLASPLPTVDMTPGELADPDLRANIRAAIEHGGPGVSLQLEVTESALIADPSLPATLRDLRSSLGVRTALNDFGTGYSSLAYLARYRVDELKIDRCFVASFARGRVAPIVPAIVSIAKALEILVVAEGIVAEAQAAEARRLGCDRGQGYFFSRPLRPEAIAVMLADPVSLPRLTGSHAA